MEGRRILDGWKAISAYLGRTAKTCRKWEHELGLPVHRLDGSMSAHVFAYADELDLWKEEKLGAREKMRARKAFGALRRPLFWLAAIAVLVILIIAGLLISRTQPGKEPPGLQPVKSIAFLPFVDLSPDKSQEQIGDGISDILINTLDRIEGLRIPARTSAFYFKGKNVTPAEIGQKLKVEWILEGSVQISDNRLRVVANLLRAADGTTVWADRYDRNQFDIFAVEDDIAQAVAKALKTKVLRRPGVRLVNPGTQNVEAYNLFLEGQHYSDKGRAFFEKAIECYQKAVEKDPNYADAYAQISYCYAMMKAWGWPRPRELCQKARAAALKALEIDRNNCDALATLAFVKSIYEWDFAGAEEDIRTAIHDHPSNARIHDSYADLLSTLGRHEEAIREAKVAVELNPLSTACWNVLAFRYYFARKYELALEALEASLELDPYSLGTLLDRVFVFVAMGRYAEAKSANDRKREVMGVATHLDENDEYTALIYAWSGNRAEARRILARVEAVQKNEYVASPTTLAMIYAAFGDKDEAFARLEKIIQERGVQIEKLKVQPLFDPIRSDPRFTDLLRRIGLEK
jgi:adenylate cyclase